MHSLSLLAVGALALVDKGMAQAGTAAFTSAMTWSTVTVGQTWPIYFTPGDGTPVSAFLGNTTWNEPVFTNLPASQGEYDWTVIVPDTFVPGNYALALVQSGAMDYSSLFAVVLGAGGAGMTSSSMTSSMSTSMTSMTSSMMMTTTTPAATMNGTMGAATADPTVTITYWDTECGCTKTSLMPSTACAVATGVSATQYTWYDTTCGCTKTAMAPANTMAASNYTAPAATNLPPAPPPTTASPVAASPTTSATRYTGAANKIVNSGLAVVGLVAAAMLA